MEKILTIKDLYFNHKKSLTEISEIVKTSISYISKVLRKDIRYTEEKEKRKQENLTERKKIQKEIIYNKRREIKCTDNIDLKSQHEQAVKELSKHSVLGKEALRKWCSSAYKYNPKKKRYEFDTENLLNPADFPLYIGI